MESIFTFQSYRKYLATYFSGPGGERGLKAQFARHIQCQGSFISQVLSAKADLSLDQAFRATTFLGHDTDEADFFLLLVQRERSGDLQFQSKLAEKIATALARRSDLKSRIQTNQTLSLEAQAEYYSSWSYSAVHVAASLRNVDSPTEIANRLSLPLDAVNAILRFLADRNMIVLKNDSVSMGPTHIHLPSDSVLIKTHHTNWRSKAIQSLDRQKPNDLHYSVVGTLSEEDARKIRARIADFIEANMKIIAPSAEERVFAHTIDFFEP